MQDIQHRLELVEQSIRHRRQQQGLVPKQLILLFCIAGISTGALSTNMIIDRHDAVEFQVEDYKAVFVSGSHPVMDGRYGFTFHKNDLFIQSGRSIKAMNTTCNHEWLHNQYPDASHDWIYEKSEEVVVPVCQETIVKAKKHNLVR